MMRIARLLAEQYRYLIRVIHTLRHLRLVQIYGRFWHRLYRPGFDPGAAPGIAAPIQSIFSFPLHPPSLIELWRFRFLNQNGTVEHPEDWNSPDQTKLWLYNLHYFDDLNASGADERVDWHRALIQRWIAENPPVAGNGWEPYPTSLRIVNWIKWALQDNEMEPAWLDSLAMQIRYLRKRLEYHLLGNHLFANAKALVFGGLYFSGDEAEEWLCKGLSILERELPEQVLADGGHFERTPMYHEIILEDLLDLINLGGVYGMGSPHPDPLPGGEGIRQGVLGAKWFDTAQRMLTWLRVMCHPDGEIGFFNDATLGIAPSLIELESYAERLGLNPVNDSPARLTHLRESGYIRLQQDEAVALLDVGEIGPDYLPGHAHADTLSFELSLFDQRLIVNSGISCYGASGERLRQRGTAAHSTVEIDGENSSEVWGGFRVARRAKPFDLKIAQESHKISVACAHDGYRRLPGSPVHNRSWVLQDGGLIVTDSIRGEFTEAVAYYHLHPDVNIIYNSKAGEGAFELKTGQSANWSLSGGQVSIEETTWHPGFGLSLPNKTIKVIFTGREVVFTLQWNIV